MKYDWPKGALSIFEYFFLRSLLLFNMYLFGVHWHIRVDIVYLLYMFGTHFCIK